MNPLFRFPVLETPRLRLRQPTMGDTDALYAYRSQSDFSAVSRVPQFSARWEAEAHLFGTLAAYYQQKKITWILELATGSPAIGSVSLLAMKEEVIGSAHRLEISSEIASAHRGQGLIPEAKRQVILWAFAKLRQLSRIHSEVASTNTASLDANKKLGFRVEGTLRSFEAEDGDVVVMSLLRGEIE